jgi:hypothetical protein
MLGGCLPVIAACRGREPPARSDAGAMSGSALSAAVPVENQQAQAETSVRSPPPGPVPPLPPFDAQTSGESHRSLVPRLEADPMLRAQLAVLREHFGATASGPFELQRAELRGGRTALLVTREGQKEPMVLVVDRDALAWTKPRPTAGMVAPVEHPTIAPRPDGGVAFFGWVAALHLVAARMWADDGNAFGDFEVFAPEGCDAMSVASAPGQGWIVGCAARTGSRAQRLREDATAAWGKTGIAVGSGSATAPLALAFDSASTLLLVERAAAVGGDRLLAYRYAASDGAALWNAPIDLGVTSGGGGRSAQPAASALREGAVRVSGGGRAADVLSDGGVIRSAGK